MPELSFPNQWFAVIASIIGNVVSAFLILKHVLVEYQSGAIEQGKVQRRLVRYLIVSTFCWATIFIVPLLLIGAYVFGLPWLHMGEVFLAAGAAINFATGAFFCIAGYAFLKIRLNG